MNQWIKFGVSLLFLIALSALYFFRDFVFVNANGQMKYLDLIHDNEYGHLIFNYTHSKMEAFFNGWSIADINSFKWTITFGFTAAFGVLSATGILLTKNKKLAFYTLLFYAINFILAFLITMFSVKVATEVVHFLHSPVPFLLFLAATKLKSIIETQHD